MKLNTRNILDVFVFLLMLLFIYAAAVKLFDYSSFRNQLRVSMFFKHIPDLIALGIPLLELGTAIFLFTPRLRLTGLYASFTLMLAFTVYIAYMLMFIDKTVRPCGCGGILNKLGWEEHLIFNIAFTLLAALGILLQKRLKNYKETSPGY